MKVLGIETATPSGAAALIDSERLLGAMVRWGGRAHSQRIMTGVRQMMLDLGLKPGDLNGIAVSLGPGSFTGVRVGLAAAKAISYGAKIPIVGIPTLEAFAYRAAGPDERGEWFSEPPLICPILDARRGEVYWSAFEWSPQSTGSSTASSPELAPDLAPESAPVSETELSLESGMESSMELSTTSSPFSSTEGAPNSSSSMRSGDFHRAAPDSLAPVQEIASILMETLPSGRPVLVCGEGAIHQRKALETVLGSRVHFAPPHRMVPGAEEIAWMGLRRLVEGKSDDPLTLTPIYLRGPDVQFPRRLSFSPLGPPQG